MRKRRDSIGYVLILMDYPSCYVWLNSIRDENARNTAHALTRWFAEFLVAKTWISGEGTHSMNIAMKCLPNICV